MKLPINYNEGWNAYYALKAFSNLDLYQSQSQWTAVNYPPLSFYIVGGIGKLLGDPLQAGRYISFLALLVVSLGVSQAVKQLGGRPFDAVFSGIFCLALFGAFSNDYVGMNDPQLLAHAFVTGGLLCYLRKPADNCNLLMVASFVALGLFTKHNLIALPIAITIDLLLRSRQKFLRWLVYFALLIGAFTVITCTVAGIGFLDQVSSSRLYRLDRLFVGKGLVMTKRLVIPLLATMPWLVYALSREQLRVVSLYLLLSILVGFYAIGGDGTNFNMFFDAYISLSIAAGMLLSYLNQVRVRQAGNVINQLQKQLLDVACSAMPIVLSLSILAMTVRYVVQENNFLAAYYRLEALEQIYLEDVKFLANQPGLAICEDLLLCYLAKKPFVYDPFMAGQMTATGKLDEGETIDALKSGYFPVVQLNQPLETGTSQAIAGSSQVLLRERFLQTVLDNYSYQWRSGSRAFYIYEHRGELGSVLDAVKI
ncbi:glycosyltransferase family 39 protein [Leptolyngbya sp. FACHB-261]|uniref:ArnT family glycosyltransferase n=1 Tax=Leptolyngbya sp. FACHB-261 TaxID=2692806 RepID=UPI00168855E2|nr:glycosyltransferase family 39 protein [Leptolyngbya sp. FACHB-261]MBD2101112.1 glycosyltransferase family 39 protein [Leptolyngbya sp. FACHB-261]